MKTKWSWEAIVISVVIAVCGYMLGCEPNQIAQVVNEAVPAGNGGYPPAPYSPNHSPSNAYPGQAAAPSSSGAMPPSPGQFVSNRPPEFAGAGLPPRNGQTILIATFNIQTLGKTKISKPGMAEKLAEIIRQFDIVAIQEIRDRDQETIPILQRFVNATGVRYDYLISQPLGRTVSKEQYAYFYNTATIAGSPDATYIVDDAEKDYLHREPFVARFLTRVPPNYRPFSFTLVNIHTDPDEVAQEIPVMHTVLKSIREFEYRSAGEDDVLLMGDLNAEPRQFGELGRIPDIYWVVDREPTNTRRTKIYDNILFDRMTSSEFTGRAGVLDLNQMFGLRTEQALEISDHLPVWAEFYVTEQPYGASGRVASGDGGLGMR